MPELPEVEVTKRSFAQCIQGAVIHRIVLGKPLRRPLGIDDEQLIDLRVVGVRRRGKYLLLDLSEGILLIHLGMSGSVSFLLTAYPDLGKHDHFAMYTSHGLLRLNDPRRFGAVVFLASEQSPQAHQLLAHLGVEPLDDAFTVEYFARELAKKKMAVKSVLLMGRVVVGVGNIYASEVLFLAKISPWQKACELTLPRVQALHAAIRSVLSRAIEVGGSTLRNFTDAHGAHGRFQQESYVYGRAGQSCRVCGAKIQLLQQAQRSTYFCSICQVFNGS